MHRKYFGESVRFSEEEREEAKQYLTSWKKFLIRSLQRDAYDVNIIEEDWGERPAHLDGALVQRAMMYLKVYVEADWNYELDRFRK